VTYKIFSCMRQQVSNMGASSPGAVFRSQLQHQPRDIPPRDISNRFALVHRLEVEDIAAYLQDSGLSALQNAELKAAVAEERQVDLQVCTPSW